jgi:hypothetical protein
MFGTYEINIYRVNIRPLFEVSAVIQAWKFIVAQLGLQMFMM